MHRTRRGATGSWRWLQLFAALALLLAFGIASCGDEEEEAGQGQTESTGEFQLLYDDDAVSRRNIDVYELVRESEILDSAVQTLNENLRLQEDVEILVTDDLPRDLADGPAYLLDERVIVMPASFLTDALALLQYYDEAPGGSFTSRDFDLFDATFGAVLFILYHEAGHALVHQLELPITAREEDAVDALAAVLTTADPEQSVLPGLSATLLFEAYAELGGEPAIRDYADEHLLDRQRVFQFLCYIVGSDPDMFWEDLVGPGLLPPARAGGCPAEWEQVSHGWFTLLAPHVEEGSEFAAHVEDHAR